MKENGYHGESGESNVKISKWRSCHRNMAAESKRK